MPSWLMPWNRERSASVGGEGRSAALTVVTPPVHAPELDAAVTYRRFGSMLYRHAVRLLAEPQEALDVIQEVFLELVKTPALLTRKSGMLPLLLQMVAHRAMDRLRRRARWNGILCLDGPAEEDHLAEEPLDSPAPSEDGGLGRVEAAQDLALLTRGETPQALTVAVLYHVEGYTAREVAQTLDVSTKTVSRVLERFAARARKRAARLGQEQGA